MTGAQVGSDCCLLWAAITDNYGDSQWEDNKLPIPHNGSDLRYLESNVDNQTLTLFSCHLKRLKLLLSYLRQQQALLYQPGKCKLEALYKRLFLVEMFTALIREVSKNSANANIPGEHHCS